MKPSRQVEPPQGPCPNCGIYVDTPYCPGCGQRNRVFSYTLREVFSEALEEFTDVDSRVFTTLRWLFLKPGELTNAYLNGQRVRFISPVRLYLVLSVIFFLMLSLKSSLPRWRKSELLKEWSHQEITPPTISGPADSLSFPEEDPKSVPEENSEVKITLSGRDIPVAKSQFAQLFRDNLAKILFLFLPGAAFLFKLLYLRRKRKYVEHLIFVIHVHAFLFILMIPAALVQMKLVSWIAVAVSFIYLFLAMKNVYAQSMVKTGIKLFLLITSYSFMILLGLMTTLLLTAMLLVAAPAT